MEAHWPQSPKHDNQGEPDSSLFDVQSMYGGWVSHSQQSTSDPSLWLENIEQNSGKIPNASEDNDSDSLGAWNAGILVNHCPNLSSRDFGDIIVKNRFSFHLPNFPFPDIEFPEPSIEGIAEAGIDPILLADSKQSPTGLLTIDPSTLAPIPDQQRQSSRLDHSSYQNEELQWSHDFVDSATHQVTDQQTWTSSVSASLHPEPRYSSGLLSPSPSLVEPPKTSQIIVPLVAGIQQLEPKEADISAHIRVASASDPSSPTSPNSHIKKVPSTPKRPASFETCLSVFETTPGALTKVKRRKKLNPTSHKSFKVTRKIGSCLECRFRKRPCNPGNPCEYCVKVYGSPKIAQLTCRRESPFVCYDVTDYFLLSSGRRIIDFNLKTKNFSTINTRSHLTIDGRSGPCSLPLKLPISWQPLESLPLEDQAEVWRTKRLPTGKAEQAPALGCIAMIPENDHELGERLETWAIRYSCKFSRFFSKRYPTAYAFSVGWIYASKKLPEHELVGLLLKCAALAYVLRAGVKCPASEFHTIQARIDTLLYRRLRAAEATLYAALQKLVWVSAGRLKREQLWPVAYILWQQMRSTCLRSSHVDNLVNRSKGSKTTTFLTNVDKLSHCFNLLLSTHTALFRSNSPIIMDFSDPANQDILGNDQEMIDEAMKLRKIILDFREHSLSRPFKSSNWYKDTTYRRFRKVLNGRGGV